MPKVKLVYFKGCPNVEKVSAFLAEAGVDCTLVCQDDLPPEHPLKECSSPTIIKDGKIVFGAHGEGSGGACSVNVPSAARLLSLFRRP